MALEEPGHHQLQEGSWVLISRVISSLNGVIAIVTPPPLVTTLRSTHEPPSSVDQKHVLFSRMALKTL